MKGLIIYKSKYGATAQYAGWLSQELNMPLANPEDVPAHELAGLSPLILGTSVHAGKMNIRNWLQQNRYRLQRKKLFLFVVSNIPASQPEKRQVVINANVPAELRERCEIFFLPGRLEKKQLSFWDRLVLKLATWMEKDPAQRVYMQQDHDDVKREQIVELLRAVAAYHTRKENKQKKVDLAHA